MRVPKKTRTRPAREHPSSRPTETPAPPHGDPVHETALAVARAGLARRAHDIVLLDLRHVASYADYVVVMSADSEPQLGAVADQIEEDLAARGRYPIGVEGVRGGRWALVDFGDVVAHIFNGDARAFYNLEGLWSDAPRYEVAD